MTMNEQGIGEEERGDSITPLVTTFFRDLLWYAQSHATYIWFPIILFILYYWLKPHINRYLDAKWREKQGGGWAPSPDIPLSQQDQKLAASRERMLKKIEDTAREREEIIRQNEIRRRQDELRLMKERETLNKEKLKKAFSSLESAPPPSSYRPSFSMRNQRRGG